MWLWLGARESRKGRWNREKGNQKQQSSGDCFWNNEMRLARKRKKHFNMVVKRLGHVTQNISHYFEWSHYVCLDWTYFCWNWKHCSEIIFKCVNSTVGPISNKKVTEKYNLWDCKQCTNVLFTVDKVKRAEQKKKEKKREKRSSKT